MLVQPEAAGDSHDIFGHCEPPIKNKCVARRYTVAALQKCNAPCSKIIIQQN
jgi:hypothetical protein